MKLACAFSLVAVSCVISARGASPADTPRKPDSAIGEVLVLDPASQRLTLKPDTGDPIEVSLAPGASLLRARPGGTSLADAASVSFAEIATGDRVLVRGTAASDRRSIAARQVVVMTRADIVQKHEAERESWRRNSVLGAVTAVDTATGEITLRTGRGAITQPVIVESSRAVVFRRYAPDSVRFTDARPSSLAEVRVGDQLRVLGERTADRVAARQIVFGTFRTLSGAVSAVDPGRGQLTLTDEVSERPVTVSVGPDARLHQLPPEYAARLASISAAPPHDAEGSPAERHARSPRAGGGAPEEMLDRLPRTTLGDLKPGDRILISSSEGHDSARANAIVLVSGLPSLPAAQARGGRGGRGAQIGVPADLLDLGMSLQ